MLTNPESVKLIRLSKQLVTLVRDVAVETPLEALATPKLDGKRLVAFFKAMEFTTITRRVAEICGVDAGAIEPDPRFVGAGGWRGRNGGAATAGEDEALQAPPSAPAPLERSAARRRPKARRRRDLAGARAREARAPIDRSGL